MAQLIVSLRCDKCRLKQSSVKIRNGKGNCPFCGTTIRVGDPADSFCPSMWDRALDWTKQQLTFLARGY